MQYMTIKKKLLRWLDPLDRTPGASLWAREHHGGLIGWNDLGVLHTLETHGLSPSDRVLDYGCGPGRLAEQLFRFGVKHYAGVDCNLEIVRYAQRNYGYPGYAFFCIPACSESYSDCLPQESGVDLQMIDAFFHPTIAVMVSLITHLLPGEIVPLFKSLHKCQSTLRLHVTCLTAKNDAAAAKLGAPVQVSRGVWIKRKDNPSAIVVYDPDLLRRLAPGWRCELFPAEQTELVHQDLLLMEKE